MAIRPAVIEDIPAIHHLILALAEYEKAAEQMIATHEDLVRVVEFDVSKIKAQLGYRDVVKPSDALAVFEPGEQLRCRQVP